MLVNKFKTPVALTLCSESSDGFVVRKARSLGRSESLQVRASSSAEGTGWLDSASTEGTGWLDSASTKFGKVASFVERKLEEVREEFTHEVVEYFGTAVIMKKLQMLEMIDRVADIQDDTSELVGGKRVTVQLISTNIDPRMKSAIPTGCIIIPKLESAPISNCTNVSRYTAKLLVHGTELSKLMNILWLKLDLQTQVKL